MTIKDRLRDRRITGMYGNSDQNDWSIELNEGVDPLCVEAADEIERLESENAEAKAETQRLGSLINSVLNLTGNEKLSELAEDYLLLKIDLAKARSDALEEADQVVIGRGYDIGGAVDPTRTASAIRAVIKK